jgi:hypothetical protein
MSAQKKSAETRRARKEFKEYYGEVTFQIVRNLEEGREPAHNVPYEVSDASIATTQGNYTRGIYDWAIGPCNFE